MWRNGIYAVRSVRDVERLLKFAYETSEFWDDIRCEWLGYVMDCCFAVMYSNRNAQLVELVRLLDFKPGIYGYKFYLTGEEYEDSRHVLGILEAENGK